VNYFIGYTYKGNVDKLKNPLMEAYENLEKMSQLMNKRSQMPSHVSVDQK